MTFDEWWEDFVAEHDDWKYADSEALRRAAFQAGAASRDAEVAELVAALETVIANAPEPYCAITRAVDAQCRAALAKVRKP